MFDVLIHNNFAKRYLYLLGSYNVPLLIDTRIPVDTFSKRIFTDFVDVKSNSSSILQYIYNVLFLIHLSFNKLKIFKSIEKLTKL